MQHIAVDIHIAELNEILQKQSVSFSSRFCGDRNVYCISLNTAKKPFSWEKIQLWYYEGRNMVCFEMKYKQYFTWKCCLQSFVVSLRKRNCFSMSIPTEILFKKSAFALKKPTALPDSLIKQYTCNLQRNASYTDNLKTSKRRIPQRCCLRQPFTTLQ